AAPPGVITVTGPVVAPAGTVVLIVVALVTDAGAATPLNFTVLPPTKVVPVIVTLVPTAPLSGVRLSIVGTTLKVGPSAAPPGVVTATTPVVAVAGTCVSMCVSSLPPSTVAATPLNFTAAPARLVPWIVTAAPAGAPPGGV